MFVFDRPLSAGLTLGLVLSLAFSAWHSQAAHADEREGGLRYEDRAEGMRGPEDREREALERHQQAVRDRLERERDLRNRIEDLGHRTHERTEGERHLRDRLEQERHVEQERRERLEREIEEREKRERDRHLQNQESEIRELEIHRKRLELEMLEIEMAQHRKHVEPRQEDDGDALDAIAMAKGFLPAEAAAEFFADVVDDVESPSIQRELRLRLAEAYFRSDRAELAIEQLRILIAP